MAVDLPAEIRERIVEAQRGLRAAAPEADVRWASIHALHVTLHFLGELADARQPELLGRLSAVAADHAAVAMRVRGLGAFPTPARARVLWAGITTRGDALARLASTVREALEAPGPPRRETQTFRPHVSIGRVRSPRGFAPLAAAIQASAELDFGAWTAREMVLYRSHLRPRGAVYEPLAHVPLARGNG